MAETTTNGANVLPDPEPNAKLALGVSSQQTGFNDDGDFVLVYRLADGSKSRPIKFSQAEAIEIAKHYQENRRGIPQKLVHRAAANVIWRKAKFRGLLKDHPRSAEDCDCSGTCGSESNREAADE